MSQENAKADEEFTLLTHWTLIASVLIGSVGLLYAQGVQWLLKHSVLVAASADPVVTLPGAQGAGLDTARVVVVAGVLIFMVAWGVSAAARAVAARRQELA